MLGYVHQTRMHVPFQGRGQRTKCYRVLYPNLGRASGESRLISMGEYAGEKVKDGIVKALTRAARAMDRSGLE